MDPVADLARWLEAGPESKSAAVRSLASQIGVGEGVVWRWLSGTYAPRPSRWPQLERLTGIPADAWIPLDG